MEPSIVFCFVLFLGLISESKSERSPVASHGAKRTLDGSEAPLE